MEGGKQLVLKKVKRKKKLGGGSLNKESNCFQMYTSQGHFKYEDKLPLKTEKKNTVWMKYSPSHNILILPKKNSLDKFHLQE